MYQLYKKVVWIVTSNVMVRQEKIFSTEPTGKGWMMQETPRTHTRPAYPRKTT